MMLASMTSDCRWRVVGAAILLVVVSLPIGCNTADTANEAVKPTITQEGDLGIDKAAGSDSTKPPAAGDEQQSAAKSSDKLPGLKFKLQEVKVEGL